MPTGQGSEAQHTPQPLQGVPTAGFWGARACRWITCHAWFGPEAGTGMCKGFKRVVACLVLGAAQFYGRASGAR